MNTLRPTRVVLAQESSVSVRDQLRRSTGQEIQMSRTGSKNFATYNEIKAALRDASDYSTALMQHEMAAAKAMEKDGDPVERDENQRKFTRDLKGFIAATRSARDYMVAAANKTKHGAWLKNRLAKLEAEKLFEFHRLLANQALHQYSPRLTPRSNKVQFVGAPGSILIQSAGRLIPNKMIVTGTVDSEYFFDIDGLEEDTKNAYAAVCSVYGSEGVLPLCVRYVDELGQILKNAERNGRFDVLNGKKKSDRP